MNEGYEKSKNRCIVGFNQDKSYQSSRATAINAPRYCPKGKRGFRPAIHRIASGSVWLRKTLWQVRPARANPGRFATPAATDSSAALKDLHHISTLNSEAKFCPQTSFPAKRTGLYFLVMPVDVWYNRRDEDHPRGNLRIYYSHGGEGFE